MPIYGHICASLAIWPISLPETPHSLRYVSSIHISAFCDWFACSRKNHKHLSTCCNETQHLGRNCRARGGPSGTDTALCSMQTAEAEQRCSNGDMCNSHFSKRHHHSLTLWNYFHQFQWCHQASCIPNLESRISNPISIFRIRCLT